MRKKNDYSNEDFTIEEIILLERLRSFRVPAMVEEYKQQLQDPNAELLSFQERFTRIVNAEWFKRYNKKFNDKLKKAKLRFKDADLDESIYDPARKWEFRPTGTCIPKLAGRAFRSDRDSYSG